MPCKKECELVHIIPLPPLRHSIDMLFFVSNKYVIRCVQQMASVKNQPLNCHFRVTWIDTKSTKEASYSNVTGIRHKKKYLIYSLLDDEILKQHVVLSFGTR
jgi:hypothetical protein